MYTASKFYIVSTYLFLDINLLATYISKRANRGSARGKYFSENLKLFPTRPKTLPTRDREKMAKNYIFYTFFSFVQVSKEYDYIHSIQLAFYINAVQTNFRPKAGF